MDYQRRSLKPSSITGTDGEVRKSRISRASRVSRESRTSNYDTSKYGVTIYELEELMDSYKERGDDYQDLVRIENLQGTGGLTAKLETNITTGIQSSEILDRIKSFGDNRVFEEPPATFCSFVIEALGDLMIMILCISAFIQIVLGLLLGKDPKTDWIDGASVIIAVLIVTIISSITNYNKELKFHELNNTQKDTVFYQVIRNGQTEKIHSNDLVVGDVILINYGDVMPCDIFLFEGNGVKMDESALTGESDAMKKEEFNKCNSQRNNNLKASSPLILSGTDCIEGNGKGIVIAVGAHCQKGKIKRDVDNAQEDNQTPLEKKLDSIAENIGKFGMLAALITMIALAIRYIYNFFFVEYPQYRFDKVVNEIFQGIINNTEVQNENDKQTINILKNVIDGTIKPEKNIGFNVLRIILLCVAIIAVAIPEGLPLAVTLSLAFSIKKLMDLNNLVRKMHACETMGGANYICTDKTGTLTRNEMNIYKILNANKVIELKETQEKEVGLSHIKKGTIEKKKSIREDNHDIITQNDIYWNILKESIALNVDCSLHQLESPNENGDTESYETKNKTDKAFIDFLYRFKTPLSNTRELLKNPDDVKQFPFDSKRKRMTTFLKKNNEYILYTKGGAENVVNYCSKFINPEDGKIENLNQERKDFIQDQINKFNRNQLRSLYLCYKEITQEEFENPEQQEDENSLLVDQKDLIFIAVVGIRDSLRDGVREAVIKCHHANVNVIMVTGDNIITATSIAQACCILPSAIDMEKLGPKDIEQNPGEMNNEFKKAEHINKVLENMPMSMTGYTFFEAIGGLKCETCDKDSNKCRCPKTDAEAEDRAKRRNKPKEAIKKDVIRNMDSFRKLTLNLRVLARSQPIHKYALVLGLKAMNKVVGVTGDGTNDAPALSKSDVGFAMNSGTDIAKDASDIIIMDDNFSSIVVAIIYGRNIYDNIRKFLQFQLSVNFCACTLVFLCACIANEPPLTTIQMLWVNLIMDSLGSLALATEPPYEELLNRQPTNKNESIINGRMWKHIMIQSLFQLILLLIIYLFGPKFIDDGGEESKIILECYNFLPNFEVKTNSTKIIFGQRDYWKTSSKLKMNKPNCINHSRNLHLYFDEFEKEYGSTRHLTMIFNIFVLYTLFNQLNCRVIDDSFNIFKRIGNSYLFPLITLAEITGQIFIVIIGGQFVNCSTLNLTGKQWTYCILLSLLTYPVNFIAKLIPLENCIDPYLKSDEEKSLIEDNERKTQSFLNQNTGNPLLTGSENFDEDEVFDGRGSGLGNKLL